MQIINQIGHLQHWGITPAVNFLSQCGKKEEGISLKILLTGTSDIRHILKTLCDIDVQKKIRSAKMEIYFHETHKEILCRALLFLHIIHQVNLNFQERVELFLDLYGNALIKERNSRYLSHIRLDLLNLIHEQKKIESPLKNIVNLKLLKFQQRDEMSEIINSWSDKISFDISKLRDQRLRYLFRQRYDYRANLVDWDYNMLLTQFAPIIHFYHYKQWRLTGLAFEQRFSTYTQPNRTLASYIPGKKKQERTSCVVRGYWGDIVISPFIAMGIQTNSTQKQLLFKKANMKYVGHSVELTEYNLQYWLQRIETETTYIKNFHDYYRTDEQGKRKLSEKEESKKKKKQKTMRQQNQLKQIKQIKQQWQNQKQQAEPHHNDETLTETQPKTHQQQAQPPPASKDQQEDLDSEQEQRKTKIEKQNLQDIKSVNEGPNKVLKLFTKYGIQFHPFSMQIEKLTKNKFKQYFDVIVCGFIHSAYLSKQRNLQSTLKKGGQLFLQTAQYIIPKKKQERKQLREKLKSMVNCTATTQMQDGSSRLSLLQQNNNYLIFQKLA